MNFLGRRFTTRGSTRPGLSGLTIKSGPMSRRWISSAADEGVGGRRAGWDR